MCWHRNLYEPPKFKLELLRPLTSENAEAERASFLLEHLPKLVQLESPGRFSLDLRDDVFVAQTGLDGW
jgi:hypothetical protein